MCHKFLPVSISIHTSQFHGVCSIIKSLDTKFPCGRECFYLGSFFTLTLIGCINSLICGKWNPIQLWVRSQISINQSNRLIHNYHVGRNVFTWRHFYTLTVCNNTLICENGIPSNRNLSPHFQTNVWFEICN